MFINCSHFQSSAQDPAAAALFFYRIFFVPKLIFAGKYGILSRLASSNAKFELHEANFH